MSCLFTAPLPLYQSRTATVHLWARWIWFYTMWVLGLFYTLISSSIHDRYEVTWLKRFCSGNLIAWKDHNKQVINLWANTNTLYSLFHAGLDVQSTSLHPDGRTRPENQGVCCSEGHELRQTVQGINHMTLTVDFILNINQRHFLRYAEAQHLSHFSVVSLHSWSHYDIMLREGASQQQRKDEPCFPMGS